MHGTSIALPEHGMIISRVIWEEGAETAMQHQQEVIYIANRRPRPVDRRAHPRREVRLRVDCSEQGGRSWWGLSKDLSRGGMFLEYTPGVCVGDTLTIAFILPSGLPCKLAAQVVRVEALGAGLRFVEPSTSTLGEPIDELTTYCAA
jgi:hypothetical protein